MVAFSGIEINVLLLLCVGLAAGILSGFTGVGGAFIVTPALIILGLPANLAVGTSLTWVTGNSIIGAFRHRKLGNVDVRLGIFMILAIMGGMELGVRIINRIKETGLTNEVVLSISTFILCVVGLFTFIESFRRKRFIDRTLEKGESTPVPRSLAALQQLQRINIPPILKFSKSRITISLWVLVAIGILTGMIGGLMGVGGGFIITPALIYLFGIPSFLAVGTNLFQTIFSAAYGSIRHAMSDNVIIWISLILLVASGIGVQFGVAATKYVRGVAVRFILGITILLAAVGAFLKLLNTLIGGAANPLEMGALSITFLGLGLAVAMICTLFWMALRYRRGHHVPIWLKSLIATDTRET